jgi:2'-5' RNA ligase
VIKIPTPPSLIPGYTTCEYRIIIQPHEDLCDKINLIKKLFAETFQLPLINYSKPDISLVRFTQYEIMEERIIHRIKNIATTIASFKVELKDFGSFPTHSLFINVATKTSIIALVKELKSIQKSLKLNEENKPHFITEPIVSIAAKLLPWQYEKGWLEYSNTPFTAMFMVEDILLEKRNSGEKKYHTIQRFQLQTHPGSQVVMNKAKQLSFF